MSGRLIDRNSLADAKTKEAYIRHKNMQYGMALREKLNESIINGEDYSIIYQLSIKLDELIAQYYRNKEL